MDHGYLYMQILIENLINMICLDKQIFIETIVSCAIRLFNSCKNLYSLMNISYEISNYVLKVSYIFKGFVCFKDLVVSSILNPSKF